MTAARQDERPLLEVTVGPPHIVTHQGHAILVTDPDGQVPIGSQKGFYCFDTRLISQWSLCINSEPLQLLNSGNLYSYACRLFLTNRETITEKGPIPAHMLQLILTRIIDGGLHEEIDIANYAENTLEFNLEVVVGCDFADIFEVKAGKVVQRGRIASCWSEVDRTLRTTYRNQDFSRELTILVAGSDSPPAYANGRIRFAVAVEPHAHWRCCLLYEPGDGKARVKAPRRGIAESKLTRVGEWSERWHREVLKLETSNQLVGRLFKQATDDVASLRLPIASHDGAQMVTSAGVPWFVALFGRDSLISALQGVWFCSEFASGLLEVLGGYQATEWDDYRDAEPGKIPHELRLGELAHFNEVPHSPYYGTADATMLYLIVLHATWRATGDRRLLERHHATATRCLEWIDRYGDRDGDGFQEYASRSKAGLENQGWKDAHDSVLNVDGSPVEGPKALCELQGYVYDAWQRTAEIFDELGDHPLAQSLRGKAAALFERFNAQYWDEPSGFYAYALDGKKRKVLTVASNPGHCLWSGIVPIERANNVVHRLTASDMSGGWGLRTLSSEHPAFNPLSYQNGSVWPHDNGLIALGMRRYGFGAEASRIAHDVMTAGSYFARHQMPELYSGLQRELMNFPVQYLGANVPQAWAAGSIFMFIQTILGLVPDAPRDRLYLDPHLPDWLPDVTLRRLPMGQRMFDIRFWREGEQSRFEVLSGEPDAVVRRCFATGPRSPTQNGID